MLKDMTLGQFFPGKSIIHKLDPRIKILAIILFIVAVFTAKSAAAYVLVAAVPIVLIIISGINLKTVLGSIKPLAFIIVFTAVINLFWTGGEKPLVSFWIINIYPEGIVLAVKMIVRLISLITGTFVLLTYTTSPVALTDAIEQLISPLKKLGVPTHEFSMMMSIALRFIPTLIEETDKIISAQKSRGANFEEGSLMSRAKALVPVLIPLFVSAFRRADELACAMECRLYHGGEGRTKLKVFRFSITDFAAGAAFVLLVAGVLALNMLNFAAVL